MSSNLASNLFVYVLCIKNSMIKSKQNLIMSLVYSYLQKSKLDCEYACNYLDYVLAIVFPVKNQ